MTDKSQKSMRNAILAVDDIPTEMVEVPEWGVTLLLKGMNGKQRAAFLKSATDAQGNVSFDRFYAELVIASAYDPESGEQVFEAADRDALNEKSGRALERLASVATRLSGIGGGDLEEAKKD